MSDTPNFNQPIEIITALNNKLMTIEHSNETKNGHFKVVANEVEAGRMTYTWAGEDRFIIDHTEVEEAYNGKGVGKEMLIKAVEFAREKGIKILPLCPFAKSVFDKTAEFRDVL